MNKKKVRILKTQLESFKNVHYGEITYVNYYNAEYRATLNKNDIIGIYGQNGSGKTAMVEALDVLKYILSGQEIPYPVFEGLIDNDIETKMTTIFYAECLNNKYKVQYTFSLKKVLETKKINICDEELIIWQRGAQWKSKKKIHFRNPFYNASSILDGKKLFVESEPANYFGKLSFYKAIDQMAIFCGQRNISLFFNEFIDKNLTAINDNNEEALQLLEVLNALYDFGRWGMQVIKVSQLGQINTNAVLPINVHSEAGNIILQGCLPMFVNGHAQIPENTFNLLQHAIKAINTAISSIIPDLQIRIDNTQEEVIEDGTKIIQIDSYSVRNGKSILTKYESEGIKRIVSLLNAMIAYYNDSNVCLIVDELDSGIFEYLLGELLQVFRYEAKGQLIFTSHNLRVLEKLENDNIICSTINPKNRYIKLQGIEKNNNKRDFYIRALALGGQKEDLYDSSELDNIGYTFRKAAKEDFFNP